MTIQEKAIEQLKRISKHLSAIGETEDYTDIAIQALEQQPSEDVEIVQVSKDALKSRQSRFVIYDVEWLKNNFYLEEKIYGQPKQPCEDCISRKDVIILIDEATELHPYKVIGDSETYSNYNQGWEDACNWLYANIESDNLKTVTPQQKVGKWIKTYEPNDAEPFILWECSKCQNAERGRRSKYCPNCGSYNGGEEE